MKFIYLLKCRWAIYKVIQILAIINSNKIKRIQQLNQRIMICNPYEQLYRKNVPKITSVLTVKEAQDMTIQMSLIYNAFGCVLKDVVGLLSHLYTLQNINNHQSNSMSLPKNVSNDQKNYTKSDQMKIIQQKTIPNTIEINSDSNQNSIVEPDFNKYMINLNKKPSPKLDLHQKLNPFQSKQTKSIKTQPKKNQVQRIEVVRGKKQREALNGYSCTMCQNFYKALGQDFTDSNGINKLCNDCSRHRSNLPPTNFNTDFSQQFGFDD